MKHIIKSIAVLASVILLGNCTTYVEPEVPAPTTATMTTTQTTSDPYSPIGTTTTKRTTTTYH